MKLREVGLLYVSVSSVRQATVNLSLNLAPIRTVSEMKRRTLFRQLWIGMQDKQQIEWVASVQTEDSIIRNNQRTQKGGW
jgi:hypothetical protein